MLRKLKALFADFEQTEHHSELQLERAVVALLIELSKADFQRDPREQKAIAAAIRHCYPREEVLIEELLAEAESASAASTSLYEFTRLINASCSDVEKYQLMRELWRVAFADGNIDKYEDALVRRIADLIYLPHSEYIRAKLEVCGVQR